MYKKYMVRKQVKRELMRSIPKEELVLISVTKEESETKLEWEHSKEFEYQGSMFDVVYKEIKGEIINYWCWPDTEESSLNLLLNSLVEKKQSNNNENAFHYYQNLTFISPNTQISVSNKIMQNSHLGIYINNYCSRSSKPLTPPPCALTDTLST